MRVDPLEGPPSWRTLFFFAFVQSHTQGETGRSFFFFIFLFKTLQTLKLTFGI